METKTLGKANSGSNLFLGDKSNFAPLQRKVQVAKLVVQERQLMINGLDGGGIFSLG
jgi:hypothetical protein